MPAIPNKSTLDGTKVPATKVGEMKTAMGGLYDYLIGLLGVDGTPATARAALGALDTAGVNNLIRQIQSVTSSVAANAMTLNYAGGTLAFRNPTLSNGAPITLTVGANAITIPSGATLGTLGGFLHRLVLLEAYNGGSPVACVVNLAGGVQLDETNLISPTTISAGATSANVIYSASAVSANSPYRVVGYFDTTQTVAGTWATDATVKQGAGGQALAAMSSIGYGQTWQVVTRLTATTYTNTTGRPIQLQARLTNIASTVGAVFLSINGGGNISLLECGGASFGQTAAAGSIIIPVGANYLITIQNAATTTFWELR